MNIEYDFRVGEKAVYPSHGVGIIENIESLYIGGSAQEFYVLKMQGSGTKVMVPTCVAKIVGLRSIISLLEADKIYDILKTKPLKTTGAWNKRYRTLNTKLNTGNLIDIAEVLRDLSILKHTKELSFGEKKMFEKARKMIVSELSIARNRAHVDIEEELSSILTII